MIVTLEAVVHAKTIQITLGPSAKQRRWAQSPSGWLVATREQKVVTSLPEGLKRP